MNCISCGGRLKTIRSFPATENTVVSERRCRECGAVHNETRILERSNGHGDRAYARASRIRKDVSPRA